jgi:hypothetical protein
MIASHCPIRLWDECIELMADINSHTVHENFGLDGQTPQALITGSTPDISILAEFGWYEWVKWFDEKARFPTEQEVYARYLGPSRAVGSLMTAKLLNEKGNILHRSSFRPFTKDEIDDPKERKKRDDFDRTINDVLGPNMTPDDIPEDETPEYENYADEDDDLTKVSGQDDVDQMPLTHISRPRLGFLLLENCLQEQC